MKGFVALVMATMAMLASVIAAAEPAPAATEEPLQSEPIVAVGGIVSPLENVAATVSLRVAAHHALRVNVASYPGTGWVTPIDEVDFAGRVHDVSAGWEYHPRALWRGWSIVTDVLYRRRDTSVFEDPAGARSSRATDTRMPALRAQLAYTLRLEGLFIATGVGASFGYEVGEQRDLDDYYMEQPAPVAIRRYVLQPEWFVRVGWVFGR